MARRTRLLLATLAIVLLGAFAYADLARNGFVDYDDADYVTSRRIVQRGLSATGLRWAATTLALGNWHPLTWTSHMLDVELYGLDPAGHHATSLLLFLATSVLLFLLLERTTGALAPSLFVAALFVVHPLHVESVAWVAERKDVLSGFWFLAALGAYGSYVRAPSARRYGLVVVAFALALMAKATVVTLPVVLLVLDDWPLRRSIGARRRVVEKIPLLAMALGAGLLAIHAQAAAGAVETLHAMPPGERLANAAVAGARYLAHTAWPDRLAVFYPRPARGHPVGAVLVATTLLVVVSVAALALRRRAPAFLAGWLWSVVTVAPVIGFLQVGDQAMADRYAYLPLVGVAVSLAFGAMDCAGRSRGARVVLATAGVAALLVLATRTRVQVRVWHDDLSLFSHAIAVTEENHVAQAALGVAYARAGEHERAMQHHREAIRIRPAFADAHANLGLDLERAGRLVEAEIHYREAIQRDPAQTAARVHLGLVRLGRGDVAGALVELGQAVAIDPELPEAWNNLGYARARAGAHREAIAAYDQALRLEPRLLATLVNRSAALAAVGRLVEAERDLGAALALRPREPVLTERLLRLRATLRAPSRPSPASAIATDAPP